MWASVLCGPPVVGGEGRVNAMFKHRVVHEVAEGHGGTKKGREGAQSRTRRLQRIPEL